jgi:topoisomerase-4 subunit B
MYIGKLGDGTAPDDGIYVLVKEVLDNCIDEHMMGYGKQIEITIEGKGVRIRDYGRGIPLGQSCGCGKQDKYWCEIRQQSFSKKCWVKWGWYKSSKCTEQLFQS